MNDAPTNPVPNKVKTSKAGTLMTELNSYHEILDLIDTNIYKHKREIKSSKRERKLARKECIKIEKLLKEENYND